MDDRPTTARTVNPRITIVIPVFNRERFVGRTLDSCLRQTCGQFAVIAVDDGSTDGSSAVIERYTDPRIRLLRQDRNRGVGPARNRGVDAATTDWIVLLDSDDELLPDAIGTMLAKIDAAGATADAFFFRCRTDDGALSPSSMPPPGPITYEDYLHHIEACTGGKRDSLWLRRRSTFDAVRFPDSYGLEDLYHLDFNRRFRVVACDDILRLYHQDADNQLVRRAGRLDRGRDVLFSRDRADVLETALERHGDALRAHAPSLLSEFLSRLLVLQLFCQRRARAWSVVRDARRHGKGRLSHFAIFALGATHPSLMLMARSVQAAASARRARRAS